MRIAILGTGMVGRTLAAGLHGIGNEVVIGTRDPAATLAREGTDGFGTWAAAHPDVVVATFAEASAGAELVVNALNGEVSAAVIGAAGIALDLTLDQLDPGRRKVAA